MSFFKPLLTTLQLEILQTSCLRELDIEMAPKLSDSKHALVSDMLGSRSFKAHEIVTAAELTIRSIHAIKSNM